MGGNLHRIVSAISLLWLALKQFDCKYGDVHLALPYPGGMLDMSVWVCVPCHCVGVPMQIRGIKQAFLISLRELYASHESSAVAHQWNLLQACC